MDLECFPDRVVWFEMPLRLILWKRKMRVGCYRSLDARKITFSSYPPENSWSDKECTLEPLDCRRVIPLFLLQSWMQYAFFVSNHLERIISCEILPKTIVTCRFPACDLKPCEHRVWCIVWEMYSHIWSRDMLYHKESWEGHLPAIPGQWDRSLMKYESNGEIRACIP